MPCSSSRETQSSRCIFLLAAWVSDEMCPVVESEWPELTHKLPSTRRSRSCRP
jgi:hypothetical protein